MNAWDSEPNFGQFTDDATGYPFVIVRHPTLLHLCGYVGLPAGHPWHGRDYGNCEQLDGQSPDVHGGLTYAGHAAPKSEPDGHWYIGFDCAHLGDLSPGMNGYGMYRDEVYRTWDYVTAECKSLAAQAKRYADACIACERAAP